MKMLATPFIILLLSLFSRVLAFTVLQSNGRKNYHPTNSRILQKQCIDGIKSVIWSSSLQEIELFEKDQSSKKFLGHHKSSISDTHLPNDNILKVPLDRWLFSFALSVVLLTTFPFDSNAIESAAIERGSVLFESNCAACHRGGGNNVIKSKTLQKDALDKYYDLDPNKMQAFVQTKLPHKIMPFQLTFESDDYSDVISYVLDQAKNDKW